MSLFRLRTGVNLRGRHGLRRAWLVGATVSLALVLAGCGDIVPSSNTYPVDFFSEMHYHKSFGEGEPDGKNAPAAAVPVTGGEVQYDLEEDADLENPYGGQAELGAEVYAVNCVHCHGPEGAGDGPIAAQFEFYEAPLPANLQEAAGNRSDGELFVIVTDGLGTHMPAFRPLLTEEERWAVVEHLREEIEQ